MAATLPDVHPNTSQFDDIRLRARYRGSMRSDRIYWVPAAFSLAAIGVMAAYVRPNPTLEAGTLAWWVPLAWFIAALAIAGVVWIAKVRVARVAISVVLLPFCVLLAMLGGIIFLPAVLALLGAAILAPGRPLIVTERPAMPGPWTPRA